MTTPSRLPKYRHYRPKDLAVVRIEGRDVYLGRFDSPESHEKYRRVLAAWLGGASLDSSRPEGKPADAITVDELILGYMKFADGYYVKDGEPTTELSHIRLAARPLRRLFGSTLARDFGPLSLKSVRQAMIDGRFIRPDTRERALCRNEVNRRTRIIVRMFRWAVENEVVPPSVFQGLKAVSGLRQGRSEAKESAPVRPAPEASVDAIRPHVSRQVWAMIELQRLTGMRPGEVTIMRTCDIDTANAVWAYVPGRHKTEHHGRKRTIYLGPRAQAVLRPWLRTDPEDFLFQPREAMAELWAERRRNRKTPIQPSQRGRKLARPTKTPGERYTTDSYRQAITKGCDKAKTPAWHPHQLRHNAATWLRREFGLDAARVILGHSSPAVTEVYAEVDRDKAVGIMGRVG